MMSEGSNFLCGRPQRAEPPPSVHMRPPESDPLRVDAINGWPLGCQREISSLLAVLRPVVLISITQFIMLQCIWCLTLQ